MKNKLKISNTRIKSIFKNHIKLVIGIILGLLLTGASVYAATIYFASSEVSYDDTKVSGTLGATTVQDALDKIYQKATTDCVGKTVNVVISPSNAGTVDAASKTISTGEMGTFKITPNLGWGNGTVNCTNDQTAFLELKAAPSELSINPTSNTTCTVTYQNVGTVTVSLSVANGSLTGASQKTITKGGEARFDVKPNSGYGYLMETTGVPTAFINCTVNGTENSVKTGVYGNTSGTKLLLRQVTETSVLDQNGITSNASCSLQFNKTRNYASDTNDYVVTNVSNFGGMCCSSTYTWSSEGNYYTISGTGISAGPLGKEAPKTTNNKWCGVSSDLMPGNYGNNEKYTTGEPCYGRFYYIYKITGCSSVSTTDSNYCVYGKTTGNGLSGELIVGFIIVDDSLF